MRSVEAGRPLGEVLENRQKWLLLASLMLAMFIGALDQTIVVTAAPSILADLGGFEQLSWLFTSYMLASTVVVPLVGKLSDIYGRRMFVLGGIVIFLVASIACGVAPSMNWLIAFRAVQGIGGGMIFASVFTTIGDIFPPSERGKYVGMFTGVFSLASILGPTFGGFLTDNFSWRWIFFINIPFCLIALPAIWVNLPSRHGVIKPRIDWAGAALLTVASITLLLSFEWAGRDYAWGSPQIIGLLAVSVVTLALFIVQEFRHPEPILPLHLFRLNVFLVSNLTVFILGMGMFGGLQYLALYVQTALGASATASGIITTPQSLGLLAASIVGGQIIARTGRYRVQTVTGSILVFVAMLFFTTLAVDTPKWHISAIMVLLGVGFGLVMPTMSLAIQNAVPYRYLGVASSSNQFFRQIGSVFGIALFAVVLTNSYEDAFLSELTPEQQQALGPELIQAFEDPTLPLNPQAFAEVQAQVLALPAGEELLATSLDAQKYSVSAAVQDIFTVAAIVAAIAIVLCAVMKELPFRRDFSSAEERGEVAPTADGSPQPESAAPLGAPGSPGGGR